MPKHHGRWQEEEVEIKVIHRQDQSPTMYLQSLPLEIGLNGAVMKRLNEDYIWVGVGSLQTWWSCIHQRATAASSVEGFLVSAHFIQHFCLKTTRH